LRSIPFINLARIMARNYKEIDNDTRGFVNEVAERLVQHCNLLNANVKKEKEMKTRLKEVLKRMICCNRYVSEV